MKTVAKRSISGISKPYQRRNKRVEVPAIQISFRGRRFHTDDWSLGGFRISDFQGEMRKNEEFIVDGIWAGDDDDLISVCINCRAVRRNGPKLSAAFVTLNAEAFEVLEALMLRRRKFLENFKVR